MKNDTTFVGMDAHKVKISVAILYPGSTKPEEVEMRNEARAIKKLARKLKKEASGQITACYEAGPCGYTLQRQLIEQGIDCKVIAPTLIPVKSGDRVKTDKRDARKLAELFRAGLLTEVHPPTPKEESVRDLCRCREAAMRDLTRSRHRVMKFVLRRGFIYAKGKAWTGRYRKWLMSIEFDNEIDQGVFCDYLLGVEQLEDRLQSLDVKLEEVSQTEPYRETVGILRCFKGIETLTAMIILAELHDIQRFNSPRELMSYLGLVPGQKSSGGVDHRMPITKTGNKHVRRILVQSSWQYNKDPRISAALRKRRQGQPRWAVGLADKARLRLHRRFRRLLAKGKPPGKVVIAVARELVGFIWAALYEPLRKTEGDGKQEKTIKLRIPPRPSVAAYRP